MHLETFPREGRGKLVRRTWMSRFAVTSRLPALKQMNSNQKYRDGHFHLCHRTIRDSGAGGPAVGIAQAHVRYVLRSSECSDPELLLPTGCALVDKQQIRDMMNRLINDRASLGVKITRGGSRRIAEKLSIALSHDLTKQQGLDAARRFVLDITKGEVPVLIAPHFKPGNWHVHVMMILPQMETDAQARVRAAREGKKAVRPKCNFRLNGLYWPNTKIKTREYLRMRWRTFANQALAEAGSDVRLCHLSHARRGIKRQPGRHFGPEALARQTKDLAIAPLVATKQTLQRSATLLNSVTCEPTQSEKAIPELEELAAMFGRAAKVAGNSARDRQFVR